VEKDIFVTITNEDMIDLFKRYKKMEEESFEM
jgi:hypothetical protein